MISQTATKLGAAPIPRLTEAECRRLEMLALESEHLNPQASALLLAELERAILYTMAELPRATVTMHAEVEYLDESSGVCRTVRLVYPNEADVARGCISILTPVAAGLIGLTTGDRIAWPDRQGRTHMLRIVRVAPPDAGEAA